MSEYKTKDFYESITLKCVGYPLIALEPIPHLDRKYYFVFGEREDGVSHEDTIMDYLNRKLLVEPRLFAETAKEFKRRVMT